MINIVHNSDCLPAMRDMEDNQFDLIVTDPPYGIDFKYNNYDDSFEGWKDLMLKFMPEALRVSRCLVMPSCNDRAERWLWSNYNHKWRMCWYKGSTGHASAIGFCDWEMIMVYGKPPKNFIHDYFLVSPYTKGDINHPCPKPIDYFKILLKRFADKNNTILDPFCGSGSSRIACWEMGFNFTGYEIDKDYWDAQEKRFNIVKNQIGLFHGQEKETKTKNTQQEIINPVEFNS